MIHRIPPFAPGSWDLERKDHSSHGQQQTVFPSEGWAGLFRAVPGWAGLFRAGPGWAGLGRAVDRSEGAHLSWHDDVMALATKGIP